MGDDTILARILGRHLMYLNAKDVSIAPHLAMNGYWEEWITVALKEHLVEGMCCVDVGANFGYYSVFFGGEIGASGRLLAVEPNPETAGFLKKNILINGMNGFCEVVESAVSNDSGREVELVIPNENEIGGASIHRQGRPQDNVVKVETVTLDELVRDWPRVDLVKIDAEGAEHDVWKGMRGVLERNQEIIVVLEFNRTRYDEAEAFLDEIERKGFELKYIDHEAEIRPVSVAELMEDRGQDWMLFLKRL